MCFSLHLLSSIILDALLGDPRWYPHPVKAIGRMCTFFEKSLRKMSISLLIAGVLTVFLVLTATATVVYGVLFLSYCIDPAVEVIVAVTLLYTTVAMKDLLGHSKDVYRSLAGQSIEKARSELAKIVGRDTHDLKETEIAKACVETVAENMVDGVTSPLFYAVTMSLLAPFVSLSPISCAALGAMIYKAVNTMDSMIGYKNEKYLQFGRAAAKLDDIVNFLPARISGFCLIITAVLLKYNYRSAAKIFFRDRLKHSSPNAGHSEAAIAGALGIQLGGPSVYFGTVVEKPYIGEKEQNVSKDHILITNTAVIVGSVVFVVIALVFRYMVTGAW